MDSCWNEKGYSKLANKLSMGILTLPLNDGYSFNVYLMKKKHTNPNPFLSSDLCVLVEMAGIEPASENQSLQASPGAVGLFRFPHRNAARQAFRFGIP